MRIAKIVAFSCLAACFAAGAYAQDYPTKPVRAIVPFTAGSATDLIARAVCLKLSELWKQPVAVENLTAEGVVAATAAAARAPKDGYTLLITGSAYAASPVLYAKLPYDPVKDFIDVAPLASQPYVLVTGPSAEFKSVSALIAAAKARPGQLQYGTAGSGSGTHFVAEKFKMAAGIDVIPVHYKGGPEANAAAMSGQTAYWFPPLAIALKPVREGKLIALGVTGSVRNDGLPSVPTIAESGVADFAQTTWWGIWAPAGTPARVVDKIAQDVARAISSPGLRGEFAKLGFEPMSMTRADFARFVRSEMASAARIAKAAGIKPQ